VDHGVHPFQRRCPGLGAHRVAGDDLARRIGHQIDTADFGTEDTKPLGHSAADEAVGSGDEDLALGQRGCGAAVDFGVAHSDSIHSGAIVDHQGARTNARCIDSRGHHLDSRGQRRHPAPAAED
jgi:hypothetical protein